MTKQETNIIAPTLATRRSPLYRRHLQYQAHFKQVGDNIVVDSYRNEGAINDEIEIAKSMGLCDLSTLDRTGFKGVGTPQWLASQSFKVPVLANTAEEQSSQSLLIKLSAQEILVLSDLLFLSEDVKRLYQRAVENHQSYDQQIYNLPRNDSHCWLAVTGINATELFSKLCAVDLRSHKFVQGAVAQTSLAKTNAIIIRHDLNKTPCFYILSDISGAEFLWDCLLDAMSEFHGAPVGLSALQTLASNQ
jgi:sarcosine oxidase subunit gamma